uniref:Uncharacterized protein n=1 Tax=Sphaerodactylus townsendi TaxID=933632 RepID=A0ACB8F4B4_9SAUR
MVLVLAAMAESVWGKLHWAESWRPVAGASMQHQLVPRSTEANIKGRTEQSHIRQWRPVAEASAEQQESALQVREVVPTELDVPGRGLTSAELCRALLDYAMPFQFRLRRPAAGASEDVCELILCGSL